MRSESNVRENGENERTVSSPVGAPISMSKNVGLRILLRATLPSNASFDTRKGRHDVTTQMPNSTLANTTSNKNLRTKIKNQSSSSPSTASLTTSNNSLSFKICVNATPAHLNVSASVSNVSLCIPPLTTTASTLFPVYYGGRDDNVFYGLASIAFLILCLGGAMWIAGLCKIKRLLSLVMPRERSTC